MTDPKRGRVLVHLASGIGNIVVATPLLRVLDRSGFIVDVLVDADYPEVGELLRGWSAVRRIYEGSANGPAPADYDHVIPAIPPFYWARYRSRYSYVATAVRRPQDDLFMRNEQAYYLEFARTMGCDTSEPPFYFLPVASGNREAPARTLLLAPGSKTGIMANKRWPYFPDLAEYFADVLVVGTADDLVSTAGVELQFPRHCRSLVGQLSICETARVLAGAGAVVASDCGLGHVAGACGVPTVLLFGPTPHLSLGPMPPNVRILRAGLSCEPCWLSSRFRACAEQITCLKHLEPTVVARAVCEMAPSTTLRMPLPK
jgi:ADP-heptose:LPS heptosyltransferase